VSSAGESRADSSAAGSETRAVQCASSAKNKIQNHTIDKRDVYLSLLHLAPCPAAAPVRSVTSSSSSSAGRGAAALMFAIACARTLKGFSPEKPSGRDRPADFGILPKSQVVGTGQILTAAADAEALGVKDV
jgi:hypothetical protein